MSIKDCERCKGSGHLCRRAGCTERRDSGSPHRTHPNAGMIRCPTHHNRIVTCDRCQREVNEHSEADGWDFVLDHKIACQECAAIFHRMEPKLMAVAWDAFVEGHL